MAAKFNVTKIVTTTKVVQVDADDAAAAEVIVRNADDETKVGTLILSRTESKVSSSSPRPPVAPKA